MRLKLNAVVLGLLILESAMGICILFNLMVIIPASLYVLEMEKDYGGWKVKYHVNLEHFWGNVQIIDLSSVVCRW